MARLEVAAAAPARAFRHILSGLLVSKHTVVAVVAARKGHTVRTTNTIIMARMAAQTGRMGKNTTLLVPQILMVDLVALAANTVAEKAQSGTGLAVRQRRSTGEAVAVHHSRMEDRRTAIKA